MGKIILIKNRALAAAGVSALMCISLVSFTGISGAEQSEVKALLKKRTEIMESMLSGSISYSAGKDRLSDIESGELLKKDLRELRSYDDTDYEHIYDMRFADMKKTGSVSGVNSYEAEICWIYEVRDRTGKDSVVYRISTRREHGTVRLVTFIPDPDAADSSSSKS